MDRLAQPANQPRQRRLLRSAALAAGLLLAACNGGGGRSSPSEPPAVPVTVEGRLTGTFTGQPISGFTLTVNGTAADGSVVASELPFEGNAYRIEVKPGRYTFRFDSPALLLPRERRAVSIEGPARLDFDGIEAGYGFNVAHFKLVRAVPTIRFNVSHLTVYAVGRDPQGFARNYTYFFDDLSRGKLSASFGGVVPGVSGAREGDVFVHFTEDVPGGLAGAVGHYELDGDVIQWVEVYVRPRIPVNTLLHEYAHAVGMPGHAPRPSILHGGGNPTTPTEYDRDAVWFNYSRLAGAVLEDTDRD